VTTYYVDPLASDNSGDGSSGDPWMTVTYALTQVETGDTVILADGYYRENAVTVDTQDGLTIRCPTGGAIFTTWQTALETLAGGWSVVDAGKKIYVSTASYSTYRGDTDVSAFGYVEYEHKRHMLIPYQNWTSFNSALDTEGEYIGPGTYYDLAGDYGAAGLIYLRLDTTEQMGWYDVDLSSPDRIVLSTNPPVVSAWGANDVTFDGITVEMGRIPIGDGSEGTTLRRCNVLCPSSENLDGGFEVYELAPNTTITECYVNYYLPSYVTWQDVKAYISRFRLQNHGIRTLGPSGLTVERCVFVRCHDAVNANPGLFDASITECVFARIQDDCVQLGTNSVGVEINHCIFLGPGTSVSKNGQPDAPTIDGRVWIHHNLVWIEEPGLFYRRNSLGGFDGGDSRGYVGFNALGEHAGDPLIGSRMVYNNTVRVVSQARMGRDATTGIAGVDQIANNIVVVAPPPAIANKLDSGATPTNENRDGNVYWHEADSYGFGLSGDRFDVDGTTYSDFDALKAATSWEASGGYLNPRLNERRIPTVDLSSYGATISGSGWPGAEDTVGSGAVEMVRQVYSEEWISADVSGNNVLSPSSSSDSLPVPVAPGATVTLRGRARNGSLSMVVCGDDGETIEEIDSGELGYQWRNVSIVARMPSEAAYVRSRLNGVGAMARNCAVVHGG
jgi:hypothetical protein